MTTPPATIPYGTSGSTLNAYLGGKGLATDSASVSKLWTGAFGSFGTTYSGTAAQNAALVHALQTGYTSNTKPNSISGSASIKSDQNTATAMGSASAAITQPTTNNGSTTPPPPVTPTSPVTTTNPTIAGYQTATQTAITQAQQDSSVALKPVTDTFNTNYQLLQNQKADAIKAAKATYAAANPNGFGSDQDEYIASISGAYDTQIQNLSTSYSDAVQQNTQQLQDNINTINATYQQNVVAYQQQQQTNLQWTLANDPPQPLSTAGIKDQNGLQSALLGWAANNSDLIQTAFSTGNYGDENNMQDYMNVVAMLASPTKASIEEQTEEENAASGASRANSEAASAGAAIENANTNAANSGATTTTTKPNFFQSLLNDVSGTPSISVTQKQNSLIGGSSSGSNNPLGW